MSLDARLQRLWYGPAWRSLPLQPLAALFGAGVAAKAVLYRRGLAQQVQAPVPVVVVGNLTVGGTGKTPVAAWVARQIALRGHRVGVVLRGYGGTHSGAPRVVQAGDDPAIVGDEAVLHARRKPHVVVIGADRAAAARLAAEQGAEIVVCDDGLQHLRLARDYEIAVIDSVRGLGNGQLLPAGPLREPASRLDEVDAIVVTHRVEGTPDAPLPAASNPLRVDARFCLGEAVNLATGERRPLAGFAGRPLHAVAGIGNPQAFFDGLRAAGLEVTGHALPDHAGLDPAALPCPADATVLMTEKDAVKCPTGALRDGWWVDLDLSIDRDAAAQWLTVILERAGKAGAGVSLG